MERIITKQQGSTNAVNTVSFEKAAAEFEREVNKVDELSCNQLIKNLLKTNLRLRKLNELSTMLLF
jgi:hypothetical protein